MTATTLRGRVGLEEHGIRAAHRVHWNPTTSLLYGHALTRGDGRLPHGGPLLLLTPPPRGGGPGPPRPWALARPARGLEAEPEADGTRTPTFIVLHPSRTEVL